MQLLYIMGIQARLKSLFTNWNPVTFNKTFAEALFIYDPPPMNMEKSSAEPHEKEDDEEKEEENEEEDKKKDKEKDASCNKSHH
jgi:hypothetical protein